MASKLGKVRYGCKNGKTLADGQCCVILLNTVCPLLILNLIFGFIIAQLYTYIRLQIIHSDCLVIFGLSKPVFMHINLLVFLILISISLASLTYWQYQTFLKKDWQMIFYKSVADYAVYRRNSSVIRRLFLIAHFVIFALLLLAMALSIYELIWQTAPYPDFQSYNQAMLARCKAEK